MSVYYQYDAAGYYAGQGDDYGGPLANNATRLAPAEQAGYIPHWTGSAWEQVENHKGEEGYVNGEPYTIKDYGPYPDGWSATPPPPTDEEQYNAERAVVEAKYTAPWNGQTGGILTIIQMTMAAELLKPTQDTDAQAALRNEYETALSNMNAEFEVIDTKYGVE